MDAIPCASVVLESCTDVLLLEYAHDHAAGRSAEAVGDPNDERCGEARGHLRRLTIARDDGHGRLARRSAWLCGRRVVVTGGSEECRNDKDHRRNGRL